MKVLRVGDVHCKPNNLKESEALMGFVLAKAKDLEVDRLEILGDLWDTHSVVRLEVTEFWDRWFNILRMQLFKTVVLVGNHDVTGNYSSNYSALHPFLSLESSFFKIVHEPYIYFKYGYLPYIHSNEKFIEEANKLAEKGATVLVSHPNYEGAVYDNGTAISNGVSPNDLDPRLLHLIGGHIHTELELGRIWYPGNSRWLTKACANKRKGIWMCTHDDTTGAMLSKEFISTESVCTPILFYSIEEGESLPQFKENSITQVELVGTSDWVSKTKKDLVGVSVSSKITDIKKSRERKSGKSLYEFLSTHYQTDKREKLMEYMKGLKLVG